MIKFFRFLFGLVILSLVIEFSASCAGTRVESNPKATVSVSAQEALYIAVPVVPDTVDTLLSHIGWVGGRFAQELRKEIQFQFNHKGVATLEDSVAARSQLIVVLSYYAEGGGSPSHYRGSVLLKTSAGERHFAFEKSSKRAQGIERADPTVDNIRLIAEAVVTEARKVPTAKPLRKSEYNPPLLMIF